MIFEADLVEIMDKWAEQFVIKAGLRCDYRFSKIDSWHYTFGLFYGVDEIFENSVLGIVSKYRHLVKRNKKLREELMLGENLLFQIEETRNCPAED